MEVDVSAAMAASDPCYLTLEESDTKQGVVYCVERFEERHYPYFNAVWLAGVDCGEYGLYAAEFRRVEDCFHHMTKNIPSKLPILCCPKNETAILKWISSRPVHEIDDCIGSCSRWQFTIRDHDLFEEITVKDCAFNETFSVEIDPEDF